MSEVNRILNDWFGEPPEHGEDELNRVRNLYEPLRQVEQQRNAMLEVLKGVGLFLHHCWCDVQMNDYSYEKLNQQMTVVDAIIAEVEGEV